MFLFFCYCSLIYFLLKFLFLLPACLWVWGFGFFLGFNDLEKEEILIWVPGCKKERIFVLSVQKVGFLAWVWLCFCVGILGLRVFYGWMCVCCVLCNACDVWTWVKLTHEHSTHSNGSRRQLLVGLWSFSHCSSVGGLCWALKLRPWRSWVWFKDGEIGWGEKRKRGREAWGLRLNLFYWKKEKMKKKKIGDVVGQDWLGFYASSWPNLFSI